MFTYELSINDNIQKITNGLEKYGYNMSTQLEAQEKALLKIWK
jgi:hypothetical protein